jgi:peptidoglycan hydrolase-like protein with peptidoglycan-binding domain
MRRHKIKFAWTLSRSLALAVSAFCILAGPPASAAAAASQNAAPGARTTPASKQPQAQAIETSGFADLQPQPAASAPKQTQPQPVVIKLQTLLDRSHFSPGVIDGKPGENLNNAIAA